MGRVGELSSSKKLRLSLCLKFKWCANSGDYAPTSSLSTENWSCFSSDTWQHSQTSCGPLKASSGFNYIAWISLSPKEHVYCKSHRFFSFERKRQMPEAIHLNILVSSLALMHNPHPPAFSSELYTELNWFLPPLFCVTLVFLHSLPCFRCTS